MAKRVRDFWGNEYEESAFGNYVDWSGKRYAPVSTGLGAAVFVIILIIWAISRFVDFLNDNTHIIGFGLLAFVFVAMVVTFIMDIVGKFKSAAFLSLSLVLCFFCTLGIFDKYNENMPYALCMLCATGVMLFGYLRHDLGALLGSLGVLLVGMFMFYTARQLVDFGFFVIPFVLSPLLMSRFCFEDEEERLKKILYGLLATFMIIANLVYIYGYYGRYFPFPAKLRGILTPLLFVALSLLVSWKKERSKFGAFVEGLFIIAFFTLTFHNCVPTLLSYQNDLAERPEELVADIEVILAIIRNGWYFSNLGIALPAIALATLFNKRKHPTLAFFFILLCLIFCKPFVFRHDTLLQNLIVTFGILSAGLILFISCLRPKIRKAAEEEGKGFDMVYALDWGFYTYAIFPLYGIMLVFGLIVAVVLGFLAIILAIGLAYVLIIWVGLKLIMGALGALFG